MILEAILDLLAWLLGLIAGLFPQGNPPEWVGGFADSLETVLGTIQGVGTWIPSTLMLSVLATYLVCLGVGFAIKVVRIVASFLTAGGGSAA